MIQNTDQLIKELQAIDLYKIAEANPRRPFDNEMTMKLLLEKFIEVLRNMDQAN